MESDRSKEKDRNLKILNLMHREKEIKEKTAKKK